jgi:hypothetical protein
MSRRQKRMRGLSPRLRGLAGGRRAVLALIAFILVFTPRPLTAADYTLGENGWQLERLPDNFVLLRSEIFTAEKSARPKRIGLMIAACEPERRRVRFQTGDTPRSPSIHPASRARAIIRGIPEAESTPIYPTIHVFNDGSFEMQETAALGGSVRGFLNILTRSPTDLEIILFKGPDTGAFSRGTALRFELRNVFESLGTIYGFEGLCFHSAR